MSGRLAPQRKTVMEFTNADYFRSHQPSSGSLPLFLSPDTHQWDPGCYSALKSSTSFILLLSGASLVAQLVKNLPAVQETRVQSLGWEDPLEKETATHSSILTWKIWWTEELGGLQSMGSQRVGHDWATVTYSEVLPWPSSYKQISVFSALDSFPSLNSC